MSNKIKQLGKAPLVYVLVQVRFSPVLSVEDFVKAIQETVRREYPRFSEAVIQNVRISGGDQRAEVATSKQWIFTNKAQDSGFILQAESLVYHTTNYEVFEDFLSKFEFIVMTVGDILELSLVERIGLRYIDFIQPTEEGDSLDDYFHSGLQGFPGISNQTHRVLDQSEAQRLTEFGRIVLRLTKKLGDSVLPPELGSVELLMSREVNESIPHAILDIDHFAQVSNDFDAQTILEKIDSLHSVTSAAFKSIVTPHALSRWG